MKGANAFKWQKQCGKEFIYISNLARMVLEDRLSRSEFSDLAIGARTIVTMLPLTVK